MSKNSADVLRCVLRLGSAAGIVNLAVIEARCGAVEGVDSHSADTRHLP